MPSKFSGGIFVSNSETDRLALCCNFILIWFHSNHLNLSAFGVIIIMDDIIINKVAESGLISFDLEEFYPKGDIAIFDLKDYLFMELILKEKDFRAALLTTNWALYQDKYVAITCTADAIIPMWANMLAASYLQPVAKDVVFGNEQQLITII